MLLTEELFGIVSNHIDTYDLFSFRNLNITCSSYLKYSKLVNKNNVLFKRFKETYKISVRDFTKYTNNTNVLQNYLKKWLHKPEFTEIDILYSIELYKLSKDNINIDKKRNDIYVLYNIFITNTTVKEYSYTLQVKKFIFKCIIHTCVKQYEEIVDLLQNFEYTIKRSELDKNEISKYFCSDTNLWQMYSNILYGIDLSDDDISVSILIAISYFMFVSIVPFYNQCFIKSKMREYINFSILIFQNNMNEMVLPEKIKDVINKKLQNISQLLYTYDDE